MSCLLHQSQFSPATPPVCSITEISDKTQLLTDFRNFLNAKFFIFDHGLYCSFLKYLCDQVGVVNGAKLLLSNFPKNQEVQEAIRRHSYLLLPAGGDAFKPIKKILLQSTCWR